MKDDGGHAFPQPSDIAGRGMSLRDYFAAMALSGSMEGAYKGVSIAELSARAYEAADAMLAERSK